MKIDAVYAYVFKIPLKTPFRISVGEIIEKEGVIFECRSNGISGWGEAAVDAVPFYAHETVGSVIDIASRVLGPLVQSSDWHSAEELNQAFEQFRGNQFAKAGLEAAYWDLLGKLQNKPCYKLLGGTRERVEAGPSIGIKSSPAKAIEAVREQLKLGMRRIKIKVCPGHDFAYLQAIREEFPAITLMADANNAYSIDDFAHLAKWDRFNLLMIEQPLNEHDIYYHAQLRKHLKTPVCLDESLHTYHDTLCAIALQAADIVNIKVCRVGGLCHTRRIHDLCQAHGMPNWIGSRVGTGVAEAARLTAASLPNCSLPSDCSFARMYMADDIVRDRYRLEDGCFLTMPEGPGMGFDMLPDKLEQYTIARHKL
jgi:O-succinylbenzoate synthase